MHALALGCNTDFILTDDVAKRWDLIQRPLKLSLRVYGSDTGLRNFKGNDYMFSNRSYIVFVRTQTKAIVCVSKVVDRTVVVASIICSSIHRRNSLNEETVQRVHDTANSLKYRYSLPAVVNVYF